MRINRQTASELIIYRSSDRNALVLPLTLLGITLVGFIFVVSSGRVPTSGFLLLAALGAYGLSMVYGVLQSVTLTLDKTADEVRCDRKTLLGTKRWQLPLSTLKAVSVGKFKRRYTKANGNRATRWSYNLTFVTSDEQKKGTPYYNDGESVDAALQAIKEFLGPLTTTQDANQQARQFIASNHRMRITPDYQTWRETIFNIDAAQAGGSENDTNQVYGVLMDVGMIDNQTSERWAISLTAFLSGEASFRPTPGGGMVGLGGEPKVAQVAQEIVQLAQTLLPKASPIEDRALPEPDLVQFLLLTPGGVYGVADDINKLLKKPEDPCNTLLNKFGFIRQVADQRIDKKQTPSTTEKSQTAPTNSLYVLAFTASDMDQDMLLDSYQLVCQRLEEKDPIFKKHLDAWIESKSQLMLARVQYAANMHTPETMQTSLEGWLKGQYNIVATPVAGRNFFMHGVRDDQGKEKVFLFYFDD